MASSLLPLPQVPLFSSSETPTSVVQVTSSASAEKRGSVEDSLLIITGNLITETRHPMGLFRSDMEAGYLVVSRFSYISFSEEATKKDYWMGPH